MKVMHIRLSIFLAFVTLVSTVGRSQTGDFAQQLKLPQVAPGSPEASSIEKFGNIPVSFSTGIPEISIPIWNVKCGDLSWPINLSYHAGGIRVDESASCAGLGWSLLAQGVISRKVSGKPDEESSLEPLHSSVMSSPSSYYTYLYNVLYGIEDAESDLFTYNFNGKSGKFVIQQDGNILQVPLTNMKISYTSALNSFNIVDEDGIVYTFAQKEMTTTIASAIPAAVTTNFNSSWHLTKVELPDKNNFIQFNYAYAGGSSDFYTTFTANLGEKYRLSNTQPPPPQAPIVEIFDENSSSSSNFTVNVAMQKLTSIDFPNGSISFNYDPSARLDLGTGTDVTNKLTGITIYQKQNGVSSILKKFILYQSYFNYNPQGLTAGLARTYRLRLDSLAEMGATTDPTPKKYKFGYNATPIVPRGNYGQDVWGFNNGVWNNSTLLQTQNVSFHNGIKLLSYAIGNSNRNVDTAKMKACMLTSIKYPTGGTTFFSYEPHSYNTEQNTTTVSSFQTSVIGTQAAPQANTTTFTYPSANVLPYSARITVDMSKFNFVGVTQRSVVSVKDLTTGTSIFVLSQQYPDQRYSSDDYIDLVPGHNYELRAEVFTSVSNSQLDAMVKIRWSNTTSTPDIRLGGGLRIKDMFHYASDNTLASKESFVYDNAVTLTPFFQISRNYSEVLYRLGVTPAPGSLLCNYYFSNLCRIYQSGSVYPLSTAMGSPMLYSRVQKFTVDNASGAVNGKTEYLYDVYKDEIYPVGGPYAIVPFITNDWKNGFLKSESHYSFNGSSYTLVKKIENLYSHYNLTSTTSFRAQPKLLREGCSIISGATISDDILFYTFPVYSGSKRLAQKISTTYDNSGNKIETTTVNHYQSSKYDFPTKISTTDSKGNTDSVVMKYPPDFSSPGNVYAKMELVNMVAPVIEQKAYTGSTLLSTIKSNYRDWYNDNKIIDVDSVQASTYSNPLETRVKYYGYDTYGNALSMSKAQDQVMSYLWAYNNAYPIAQVQNASTADIAYSSFESVDKGNWTYTGTVSIDPTVPTGIKYYTLGSSISKSGLNAAGSYIVSYWKKSGTVSVNSTTPVTGPTLNGWTYYEHKVVNPVGGTITVSGTTGLIDELRLYPLGAQMTTFNYNPLVGVTSQVDPTNRIIYYEYDELQRLILIRDQDRNIVKKIAYNYHGQTEYPNIYYNVVKTGTYYKTGCASCQIGAGVVYTVPAGIYISTISQADADNKAQADVTANGQTNANANGTCTSPALTNLVSTNQITNNSFKLEMTNTCSNTLYTFTINANTTNITLTPQLPQGPYTAKFTKLFGPGSYTYIINGATATGSADPTITGVTVNASGNTVKIQL